MKTFWYKLTQIPLEKMMNYLHHVDYSTVFSCTMKHWYLTLVLVSFNS